MWCEKCHYGSDHVEFKLDSSGNFQCLQCGTLKQPITKSPFNVSKGRTLGGNKSSGDKPAPKKFTFDQKGGTNSESVYTSGKDIPTYKDKPVEETAEKSVETLVQDTIRQATAVPVVKQPEQAPEQPVELPKQPLEPIDESKLSPFVAQPKPVEPNLAGQNEAI